MPMGEVMNGHSQPPSQLPREEEKRQQQLRDVAGRRGRNGLDGTVAAAVQGSLESPRGPQGVQCSPQPALGVGQQPHAGLSTGQELAGQPRHWSSSGRDMVVQGQFLQSLTLFRWLLLLTDSLVCRILPQISLTWEERALWPSWIPLPKDAAAPRHAPAARPAGAASTCRRLRLLPAAPSPSSSKRATAAEAESQVPAPHSPAAYDTAVQDTIQAKAVAVVQGPGQQLVEQQTLAHSVNAAMVVPSASPQNPPAEEAGTPHLAPTVENKGDAAASPLTQDSGRQHREYRDWPCPGQPCLGEALGVGGQAGACLLPALPCSCSFSSPAGIAALPHALAERRRPSLFRRVLKALRRAFCCCTCMTVQEED